MLIEQSFFIYQPSNFPTPLVWDTQGEIFAFEVIIG